MAPYVSLTAQREFILEFPPIDEQRRIAAVIGALDDKIDLTKLSKPQEFYEAFARLHAPILADNLEAKLDGQPLPFTCKPGSPAGLGRRQKHVWIVDGFAGPGSYRPDGEGPIQAARR